MNTIANGFDFAACVHGLGRHEQYLGLEQIIQAVKWAELAELFAVIANWGTKVSICFFLLRLIKRTNPITRYCIWTLLALNTITALVTCILWGVQARPIQSLWDPSIPGKHLSANIAVNSDYATAGELPRSITLWAKLMAPSHVSRY